LSLRSWRCTGTAQHAHADSCKHARPARRPSVCGCLCLRAA
jgi:hypothetical protein